MQNSSHIFVMLSFKKHNEATLHVHPRATYSQPRDIINSFRALKCLWALLQCMLGKVNIRTAWHLVTPTKLMKTLMPYNLLNRPTCPTQTIHTSFIIYSTVLKFGVDKIFQKSLKEVSYAYHDCIYLFEIEIFCNIVNVLTVTFDQINTSK